MKDLKNIWKEIKETICTNNSNHTFPTALTVNDETITNPSDIAIPLIPFLLTLIFSSPSYFPRKKTLITPSLSYKIVLYKNN